MKPLISGCSMSVLLIVFTIYILVICTISVFSYFFTKNLNDYMLAGRSLNSPVSALGVGASDMSSWLLMALPGAVMLNGLNQIWLPASLALGAYLNWKFIAKRLRIYTKIANNAITVPGYFENRFHDYQGHLRLLTSFISLIFFTFYASSGLVAGGLLFHSTFNVEYVSGLYLTALIICAYTCIGGFVAISWIDFFQGSLIFLALIIVPITTLYHLGDFNLILLNISQHSLNYFSAFKDTTLLGMISLFSWGLGYFGQPHILVRFMAIKAIKTIPLARVICMTWMCVALFGAVFTGILGVAFFDSGELNNPEMVFIKLSHVLFNPWITGILLAAVLSATMSTVSAQILVSSSTIVEDIYRRFLRPKPSHYELLFVSRMVVFIMTLIIITLALNPKSSILNLVGYAWAGLGASFGPLILFSLFWQRMTLTGAIAGMIVGALTIIIWTNLIDTIITFRIYALFPGFLFSSTSIIIASLISKPPSLKIKQQFNQMAKLVSS